MNCVEFEKIVLELAGSETRGLWLEAATRQRGWQHAQSCRPCAGRLETEKTLSRGLRAVAGGDHSSGAPATLETTLLAAFRAREEAVPVAANVIVPTFQESPLKLFFLRLKWALATAAALALVALAVSRAMQPAASQQPVIADQHAPRVAPPAPERIEAPVPPPELSRDLLTPAERPNRLQVKAAPPKQVPNRSGDRVTVEVGPFELDEPEALSAKDFLVFDYAQNLPPADSMQLMRVRMPRERLAPLGLPMPQNMRNEEFVNADFVVGSDGVPRAIRVANR